MKLVIAIVCSVVLHTIWIVIWPMHVNVKAKVSNSSMQIPPFEIHLANKSGTFKPSIAVAARIASTEKTVTSHKNSPQRLMPLINETNKNDPLKTHQDIKDAYYSIKEVDIEALPINNIDASALPASMQNVQIKLRLFIDEFGHIARIEPIKSQLYQDEMLENALSEQLIKVNFTPARRKGVDVKSYQDVAYDFNFYQANSNPLK